MSVHGALAKSVEHLREFEDIRFGSAVLCRDPKQDLYYIKKERAYSTKEQLVEVGEAIRLRQSSPNLYYVPIADFKEEQSKEFCSEMHKIVILFPFPEEDLRKEIIERNTNDQPYSNKEITTMLYDIVNGMAHLQSLGIYHTRFAPEFVALTTTGYAIVEDPICDKSIPRRSSKIFESPESFTSLKMGKTINLNNQIGVHCSDVFSCGLVLLNAALLRDLDELYLGGKAKNIDLKALQACIQEFEERYPDNNLLRTTIKKMLEIDPKERPCFKEIKEKLPEYRLIKEFFKTNPDSIPPKKRVSDADRNPIFNEPIPRIIEEEAKEEVSPAATAPKEEPRGVPFHMSFNPKQISNVETPQKVVNFAYLRVGKKSTKMRLNHLPGSNSEDPWTLMYLGGNLLKIGLMENL